MLKCFRTGHRQCLTCLRGVRCHWDLNWSGPSARSIVLVHELAHICPLSHLLLVDHFCTELVENEVEEQCPRVWHHDSQINERAEKRPVHNRLVFLLVGELLFEEVEREDGRDREAAGDNRVKDPKATL